MLVVVEVRPAEATFPGKSGKIAYSGDAGNDYEIYTIKPGGGGKVQVTDNTTGDYAPSYSPSGKKIAYQGDDGNDKEIYTINVGGGGKFNVTDNAGNDFQASWGSS
jgi:TolB protein